MDYHELLQEQVQYHTDVNYYNELIVTLIIIIIIIIGTNECIKNFKGKVI